MTGVVEQVVEPDEDVNADQVGRAAEEFIDPGSLAKVS